MRYMVIVKNDPQTEGMEMPAEQMTEMFATMGRYNEQLADAGVMLAGEGLLPSTEGFKVRFDGEQRAVVDGPFTEAKELIAGFWLLEADSRDEAIEWISKAPFGGVPGGFELEVRQLACVRMVLDLRRSRPALVWPIYLSRMAEISSSYGRCGFPTGARGGPNAANGGP